MTSCVHMFGFPLKAVIAIAVALMYVTKTQTRNNFGLMWVQVLAQHIRIAHEVATFNGEADTPKRFDATDGWTDETASSGSLPSD